MSTGIFLSTVPTGGEMIVAPGTPECWLSPQAQQNDFIEPSTVVGLYQLGVNVNSSYAIGVVPDDTLVKWWYRIQQMEIELFVDFGGELPGTRTFVIDRKDGDSDLLLVDEIPLMSNAEPWKFGRFQGIYEETLPLDLRIDVRVQLCFIGFPVPYSGIADEEATVPAFYRPDTDLWFPALAISVGVQYGSTRGFIENYGVTDTEPVTLSFFGQFEDLPHVPWNLAMVARGAAFINATFKMRGHQFFGWDGTYGAGGAVAKAPNNYPQVSQI